MVNVKENGMNQRMRTYVDVLHVPLCLVQGIGDQGLVHKEFMDERGSVYEDDDDLRITLELSGGTKILLDSDDRIIIECDKLIVEQLRVVE